MQVYLPVLLLLGFVVLNAVLMLGVSHLVIRRRPTPVKETPYESGMPPLGDARERFSVKFYMVAMLFIIFDIETVFMIPWGVHYRQLSCAVPLLGSGACPAGQAFATSGAVQESSRNCAPHGIMNTVSMSKMMKSTATM